MSKIQEATMRLVKIYREQESLSEQEKAIKDEAKASGLNPAILAAVAKAYVKGKTDELKQKSEDLLEVIEEVRN